MGERSEVGPNAFTTSAVPAAPTAIATTIATTRFDRDWETEISAVRSAGRRGRDRRSGGSARSSSWSAWRRSVILVLQYLS